MSDSSTFSDDYCDWSDRYLPVEVEVVSDWSFCVSISPKTKAFLAKQTQNRTGFIAQEHTMGSEIVGRRENGVTSTLTTTEATLHRCVCVCGRARVVLCACVEYSF